MLDWNAAKEAIRLAVVTATGIDSAAVVWEEHYQAGTWLAYPRATIKNRRVKAWDDTVTHTTGGTVEAPTKITTHSGPRRLGLEVRIETDNQNTNESLTVLSEYLRTRLFREAVLDALKVAGVAIGVVGETVDGTYTGPDGRRYSVGVTEISFNLVQNDIDTTASVDWIEHVGYVSNKLEHPNGTDSPYQFDVTIPPIEE